MYIYRVGVVGAGTMGAQIAQVVSYAGLPVVLTDVTMDRAQRGMEIVRRIYHARVERGKMTPEQAEEKMLLVSTGCDFRPCRMWISSLRRSRKISLSNGRSYMTLTPAARLERC